jgi:L-iduronidase
MSHSRKSFLFFIGSLCLVARCLAASEPTIEIDYTQAPKPLRNIWNSTGFSPADIVATKEMQAVLRDQGRLPARGLQYTRPHYLLNLAEVRDMATGHPEYDWTGLDQALDVITHSGQKLIFELMGYPADGTDSRASGYDKNFQEQLVRRKSYFDDLTKRDQLLNWRTFVTTLAQHLESRYGRDEVRTWFFETTNEPNLAHFWTYDIPTFCNYYDACSEGLKQADPALQFGGPGTARRKADPALQFSGLDTAQADLVETFTALMAHCDSGKNYLTGEIGVRLDFISVHVKDVPQKMVERELSIFQYVKERHPKLAGKPFINDEADPIVAWAKPYWWETGPWHAAFVAQNIDLHERLMIDAAGVNYRLFSNDHSFMGTWDQRTTHALFRDQPNPDGFVLIRKPVLSVMEMIAQLGSSYVSVKIPDELSAHFGLIPSVEGNALAILVYNKTEITIDSQPKPEPDVEVALMEKQSVNARLKIKGIKGTTATLRELRLDETHGNPYGIWVAAGKPTVLSPALIDQLRAAEPAAVIRVEQINCPDHEYTYDLTAPSPSVSLILIEPNPDAKPQGD